MAKIIGHRKFWFRTVCDKCNAIILFEDNELVTHDHIDNTVGICPECSNVLTFNKYKAAFAENIDEPIREIKNHLTLNMEQQ